MLFYAENMLRSRTTGGDTFVEEDTVLIQVGHIAAQFAYAVQVRDGVVVPIQRTGMRIAACAAGRRNHCRRQFKRVERTFVDLCHRFGVTSKVIVNALFDHLIVTVDGRLQRFRIAIDFRGEFFNRIRLHNPARVDFSLIILRPAISVGRNRPAHPNGCQGRALADAFITDEVYRQAAPMRHVNPVTVLVFLHVLLMVINRLIIEAFAVRIDFDPAAIREIELTQERGRIIRNLNSEPVAAGLGHVSHMPDLRAGFHQHLDAVAGVARRTRRADIFDAMEVFLHFQVVFITAAGKHDALRRTNIEELSILVACRNAIDFLGIRILKKRYDRRFIPDINIFQLLHDIRKRGICSARLHSRIGLFAKRIGNGTELGTRQIREFHDRVAPVFVRPPPVADGIGNLSNPIRLTGHVFNPPIEPFTRNGVRLTHRPHVCAELVQIVRVHMQNRLTRCN